MDTNQTVEAIRDNWAIILAFVSLIWWARQLDLKTQWMGERLNRHETRLQAQEESNHDVAVTIARQQETLNAILQRLDHIHEDMKFIRERRG